MRSALHSISLSRDDWNDIYTLLEKLDTTHLGDSTDTSPWGTLAYIKLKEKIEEMVANVD